MIAVVTGSSGFIGSHLVDALLQRKVEVRLLSRAGALDAGPRPLVTSYAADFLDARSVRINPIWDGVTHIFHLAGVTRRRSLAQFRAGNVIPTRHILDAISSLARQPRFVLVSSQAAAGPALRPGHAVTELEAPHPVEPYGQSKLEAERTTQQYPQVPWSIVRPTAVYGPRDRDFLEIFKQSLRPIGFQAAPARNLFSVVYVDDLVRAVLAVAESPQAVKSTYFVGSASPIAWGTLYNEIESISGVRSTSIGIPLAAATVAGWLGDLWSKASGDHPLVTSSKVALLRPKWWVCDSSLIRSELGWHERGTLHDTLRDTYDWYVKAGWLRTRQA